MKEGKEQFSSQNRYKTKVRFAFLVVVFFFLLFESLFLCVVGAGCSMKMKMLHGQSNNGETYTVSVELMLVLERECWREMMASPRFTTPLLVMEKLRRR